MDIYNGNQSSPDNLTPYNFIQSRAAQSLPAPHVVWLTGLSAAGKSTIVNSLNPVLQTRGLRTCILDGDALRSGLCRDLGFTDHDRDENVRRVAEVAALMAGTGMTVLVALISPTRAARHLARSIIGTERFVEVFVDAPLSVAEARDPKGLYRRAREGEITGFTGIDSLYEAPVYPELHLHTDRVSVAAAVREIDDWLKQSRRL
jgi:adenylylsulfate kinase